jgi:hypothetical protein
MLVGKDYLYDGIFKISEKTIIINNEINNKPISSYLSFFYTINLELLPTMFFFRKIIKYEICIESKFIKTFFQLIEIKNEFLDSIYSHVGDLKFMQIRCGKKY